MRKSGAREINMAIQLLLHPNAKSRNGWPVSVGGRLLSHIMIIHQRLVRDGSAFVLPGLEPYLQMYPTSLFSSCRRICVHFFQAARQKCCLMPALARSTLQGLSVAFLLLEVSKCLKSADGVERNPHTLAMLTMLKDLSNLTGCRFGSSCCALLASASCC